MKGEVLHPQEVEWEVLDPRTKLKFAVKKEDRYAIERSDVSQRIWLQNTEMAGLPNQSQT